MIDESVHQRHAFAVPGPAEGTAHDAQYCIGAIQHAPMSSELPRPAGHLPERETRTDVIMR